MTDDELLAIYRGNGGLPLADVLRLIYDKGAVDALLPLLGQHRTDTPLDPEPYLHHGYRSAKPYDPVFGTSPRGKFLPREGFEQDRARYQQNPEEAP